MKEELRPGILRQRCSILHCAKHFANSKVQSVSKISFILNIHGYDGQHGTADLFLVKSSNSRENLALKELQRGSTAGGDVGHVTCPSGQFSGSDGVTSSDDGDGTILLGQVSKDVNDAEGSLLEGLHLEHTHCGSEHVSVDTEVIFIRKREAVGEYSLGPFMMTVLQSERNSFCSAVEAGPLSRPIQPSGMASAATTWVLASAAKLSAMMMSDGRRIVFPSFSALARTSLAVSTKSSSTREVPTERPFLQRRSESHWLRSLL